MFRPVSVFRRDVFRPAARLRIPGFALAALALLGTVVPAWGTQEAHRLPSETATPTQSTDSLVLGPVTVHHPDGQVLENWGVAVANGKIVAEGPWADVCNRFPAWAKRTPPAPHLYPGWIDAHTHFLAWGLGANTVDLMGTTSWEACLQRLDFFVAQHPEYPVVFGRGWDQNDWPLADLPLRESWESRYPGKTVILTRVDGHAALAVGPEVAKHFVSKAPGLVAVPGGTIDPKTGLFLDRATELLPSYTPSRSDKIRALLHAEAQAFGHGITSVHEAGLPTEDLLLIDSLHRVGALRMPVYGMVSDRPADRAYWRRKPALKTDRLCVRSFKFYADGALGSRGALLRAPYADAPHSHGLQLYPRHHFEKGAREMLRKGWQMNTHAIGDSANGLLLSIYAEALAKSPKTQDHRWRIEHAQLLSDADIQKLSELRLLPSVQPCHATSDLPWAAERLGEDRLQALGYRYAALAKSSPHLPLGTDVPVEPIDPRRTWEAGRNAGLQNAQILAGMTLDAAFAAFEEKERGAVAPGYWASFTFFDVPLEALPSEQLLGTPVSSTWVHGEQVYLRRSENSLLPIAPLH